MRTQTLLIIITAGIFLSPTGWAQTLDAELKRESSADLAAAARQIGDAVRGAIVFHQPSLACAKCHINGSDSSDALGPNLATLKPDVTDQFLVESVLYPSKVIRQGYESMSVLTVDGQLISALLVEKNSDHIVLRDVARDGELVTIVTEDIEDIQQNEFSIMPAEQMNQLSSRQQFLDLIRYLIEIRDGGPQRAQELQPSPALLTLAVAEYENHLDHAGLIGNWDDEAFHRGESIYQRVCANCHGTHDQAGSLPTSLRFTDDKFKNGSDPLAMYRTLTYGFGQMAAQSWMVPSQKYDVIHYIREAYLKRHNPTQYTEIDQNYLAELTAPESNPWLSLTRFTGLDFFPDGRLAVCSWDGDVWIVTPREEGEASLLDWRRTASGLFQPLGVKVIDGKIHLICRDQLVVLHDLNDDGEIDFYQCLNNDHQVTEHFHEFAMGLQIDQEGNFYYAKSGCHGKAAVVPHHGTLLKVTADGSQTEILAIGFRAANGVCLNPDGSFVVTDQEGFWNPKNRINWVTLPDSGQPKFYGNILGYHNVVDESDKAMEQPLCWITNDFDRSPAELLWVDSPQWGPLQGSLLNLSYGYGKLYLVLHEQVLGQKQGGMIELPIPAFPTGVMRGRFHPDDGQLYVCGMFAWAGSATHPGGLYRVRYTEQPTGLPLELKAITTGVELTFAEALDSTVIDDLSRYSIQAWDLKRTAQYGSAHYNQRAWKVTAARLLPDGKTLQLEVPHIAPTWGMEIQYRLQAADGRPVEGRIHNTIHHLQDGSRSE